MGPHIDLRARSRRRRDVESESLATAPSLSDANSTALQDNTYPVRILTLVSPSSLMLATGLCVRRANPPLLPLLGPEAGLEEIPWYTARDFGLHAGSSRKAWPKQAFSFPYVC
jgi:hypothetical protein